MISSATELTIQQLMLRFFDLDIDIRSDSASYLSYLAQLYHHFRVRESDSLITPIRSTAKFVVLTKADNAWGQPALILDGQVWPLPDANLLAGYTSQIIFNTIAARIRSHYLIHAGAVVFGNQGLILAADSFHGKTTLTLELVQRGFKLLSDEAAALGRADRRVHPFPRTLRIRPGSLELVGLPNMAAAAPLWLGKYLLDVEQVQPDSLGQAAPIRHVIILQNPADQEAETPDKLKKMAVLVDRLDQLFLAAVRQIEDATDIRIDDEHGYPLLEFRSARCSRVYSQIEELCRAHQILLLDARVGSAKKPSFASPARLEAIPASEAVLELLERFQGGYNSAILQEFGGSTTRLFMELAAIVGQADCYRLQVGPLHEMADLVCGLVGMEQNGNR